MRTALLLGMVMCSISLGQTPRVTGVVAEAGSGIAIPGAIVRLLPGGMGVATDVNGGFTLSGIPAGVYELTVAHIGYRKTQLGPFVVHQGMDTLMTVYLVIEAIRAGPVVVTASRRAQFLEDAPISMATMNAREVASRVVLRADEAFRTMSGVTMIEDQINIRGSSGYSRGVGSRVLLLVDGIPMLTGDTGEINWETIPAHQIERVEVVKGAGSALYGSSALGGVINIITKEIDRDTRVLVRSMAGLYDAFPHEEWNWSDRRRRTSSVSATVSGRPGDLGFLISLQQAMDESYRQNDELHRYGTFGKLMWQPDGQAGLGVSWNYVRRLNGSFFWWKSLQEPAVPPDDQQQRWTESDRGNLSVEYRSPTQDGSGFIVRGQYFGNDWADRIGTVVGNRSRSDQFTLEGQWTKVIGERTILIGGISGHVDRVRSNIFGTHPGFGLAAFIQSEYRMSEQAVASAGIRWDRQKVSVLDAADQVDPRLALTYRPTPATTLRASLGTGFRYPSIGELYTSVTTGFGSVNVVPNPRLRPERSLSAEIGVHQQWHMSGWIDAALFRSDYRQLIEAGVDPDLFVIRFDNVARARIQGIELTAGMSWWEDALTTSLGITWMEPKDIVRNAPLKFRPRFIGVASIDYTMGIVSVGVDVRSISRQEAIDDDLIAVANIQDGAERVAINVVDVRLSFDTVAWGVPLRPGVAVKNALNYQYVELVGNLAPPRHLIVTLDIAF